MILVYFKLFFINEGSIFVLITASTFFICRDNNSSFTLSPIIIPQDREQPNITISDIFADATEQKQLGINTVADTGNIDCTVFNIPMSGEAFNAGHSLQTSDSTSINEHTNGEFVQERPITGTCDTTAGAYHDANVQSNCETNNGRDSLGLLFDRHNCQNECGVKYSLESNQAVNHLENNYLQSATSINLSVSEGSSMDVAYEPNVNCSIAQSSRNIQTSTDVTNTQYSTTKVINASKDGFSGVQTSLTSSAALDTSKITFDLSLSPLFEGVDVEQRLEVDDRLLESDIKRDATINEEVIKHYEAGGGLDKELRDSIRKTNESYLEEYISLEKSNSDFELSTSNFSIADDDYDVEGIPSTAAAIVNEPIGNSKLKLMVKGDTTQKLIQKASKVSGKHFDSSSYYTTEENKKSALSQKAIERSDLIVSSKKALKQASFESDQLNYDLRKDANIKSSNSKQCKETTCSLLDDGRENNTVFGTDSVTSIKRQLSLISQLDTTNLKCRRKSTESSLGLPIRHSSGEDPRINGKLSVNYKPNKPCDLQRNRTELSPNSFKTAVPIEKDKRFSNKSKGHSVIDENHTKSGQYD